MSIRSRNILVWDRGLYVFLAQKLGESFNKVWYYLDLPEPYPSSPKSEIGTGLPEIERVYSPWPYIDKADAVIFFDCYDGELQNWLKSKGHRVFGSMLSEKIELDKSYFYEELDKIGLPVPHTYRAEGIDDLCEYLNGKSDKWLKTSYYRGDFETYHYKGSMPLFSPWLNDLRSRIGRRSKDIEILVQSPIKASCEVGYDGFCINGDFTSHGLAGYEIKDKGFVAKVFKDMPEIINNVNLAMSPLFKKLGYQGHYSTELRITESGKAYFIDPTCRAPSPPSELMTEIYSNYAEAVWMISGGELPELKPRAKYGAEIILSSPWHDQHELVVKISKDAERWVKLKNHTKNNGVYTIIPNGNGGIFGAVVALGDTLKEATENAMDIVHEIETEELEYDLNLFDKTEEQVEKGRKFGIEL